MEAPSLLKHSRILKKNLSNFNLNIFAQLREQMQHKGNVNIFNQSKLWFLHVTIYLMITCTIIILNTRFLKMNAKENPCEN